MDENKEGRLGFLTEQQTATLQAFKLTLEAQGQYDSSQQNEHHLLRFLRARQFNLAPAIDMWTSYTKWRKEFGTDTILSDFDFPEYMEARRAYPRVYHKTDKLGRPVYIERIGAINLTKLWEVTSNDRMLKNHVYEYEKLVKYRLRACSLKSNRHHEQSVTILDLQGVALSTFSSVYSIVSEISSVAQNYYPEMLGKMYIINTPMLFTAVWTVVKKLLDEVTVKKINILGSNYKKALLETIDAENIPDFLGGSCQCPGGCINADIGPWNDGSVEGYPDAEMEKFVTKYLKP